MILEMFLINLLFSSHAPKNDLVCVPLFGKTAVLIETMFLEVAGKPLGKNIWLGILNGILKEVTFG